MKYRRDIDGLRALAILPVLFFHYQLRGMTGGFLGVDIFFVISGYLITKIVYGEISAGGFSIQRFYERRVRRIFPALFAVMATLLVVGYFLFLPGEFDNLGRSIVATTLFVSNFYFYNSDSYFGPVSAHEPLLHTWSLAVEEQFYLVLPVLLLLLSRFGKRITVLALWTAAALSLAFSFSLLRSHPTAAFYLPLPRAWELLCGSLLALEAVPAVGGRAVREVLGVVGLLLIAGSIVLYTPGNAANVPFAIYPCIGAACLILAGSATGSAVSRGLGHPALVYVGKISYSLYLWHWPVWIFYGLLVRDNLGLTDKLLLIALSIGVAALSVRFIERPFRTSVTPGTVRSVPPLGVAAGAMAVSVAIGLTLVLSDGVASRFPARVTKLASYLQYGAPTGFRSGTCFLEPIEAGDFQKFASATCLAQDRTRRNFLLIGDSHAAHLWIGLANVYPDINFMQATVSGCVPVLEAPKEAVGQQTCREMMNFVFHDYLPRHKLAGVILSARWQDANIDDLTQTVKYVRAYEPNVFVVGRIIEYTEPLPRILALSSLRRDPDMAREKRVDSIFTLDRRLKQATEGAGAHYISMVGTLCRAGDCRTVTDAGVPLQFDYGHLTADGSRQVARVWRAAGEFEGQ